MKVQEHINFTTKEALEVKIACQRLNFYIELPHDATIQSANIILRARFAGNFGTDQIIEPLPLLALFEHSQNHDGHFQYYDTHGVEGNTEKYWIRGSVLLARNGYLNLDPGRYIVLDVKADSTISKMVIFAETTIPTASETHLFYNPVTLQGAATDIPLISDKGTIQELMYKPEDVEEVSLKHPSGDIDISTPEVPFLAAAQNDIVCVNRYNGAVTPGYMEHFVLDTQGAPKFRIRPVGSDQITFYLVEQRRF